MSNEEIEQRVAERTQELLALNEQLRKELLDRELTAEAEKIGRTRYESLVQSIDGIVWEADPATFKFTFVSDQAERILGYPKQQWLDCPEFWQGHLHPYDKGWVVTYCK